MGSDRPLRRRLVKLGLRVALGRRRAHWQDGWPGVSLAPDEAGGAALRWRGRYVATLLPAGAFAERAGAEIVIVGSGPSLRDQRRTALPGPACVLLNGAVTLVGEIGAPLAVAIEDERFVWRHRPLLEPIPPDVLCLLSTGVLRAICETGPAWLDGRAVVRIEDLRKPYRAPRRRLEDPGLPVRRAGAAALSLDPGAGVVIAGTVAFTALQFALWAGPERIGFAGIDLGNAGDPRFYERPGATAASGLDRAQGRILPHFALAGQVAAERGIGLECYSPVSALLSLGLPFSPRLGREGG